MTLDEAIKHCEEVVQDNINRANILWDSKEKARCEDCAEEHRQLAEWLKDYKRLLEQEPCTNMLNKITEEINQLSPKPTAEDVIDGNSIKDAIWETLIEVDKIIDKYRK